jgi:hypothetical protein
VWGGGCVTGNKVISFASAGRKQREKAEGGGGSGSRVEVRFRGKKAEQGGGKTGSKHKE